MKIFYKITSLINNIPKGEKVYYLGTEYKYIRRFKLLGYNLSNLGDMIALTAEKIKYDLINYISLIGKKQKNPEIWWMSNVASKFNLKTIFFDRIILLETFGRLSGDSATINIAVSDPILFLLLKTNSAGVEFKLFDMFRSYFDLIIYLSKLSYFFLKNRFVFFIEYAKYNSMIRSKRQHDRKNSSFIYSWIEERSFDKKGEFDDVYLPGLLNLENEKSCIFLPYYAKIDLINKLGDRYNFISLAMFSNINSILKTLFTFFTVAGMEKYKKFDIKILWLCEIVLENSSYSFITNYHDYLSYRKFFKEYSGVILYPYENQPWEKAMILAAQNSKSNMKFVGYQHSTIGKMQLNYHTTGEELVYMPLPDAIIVNSDVNFELMKKLFQNSEVAINNGGALRYNENEKPVDNKKNDSVKTIGVLLPIDRDQAEELFDNVISNSKSVNYKFIVKFHPDTRLNIKYNLPVNLEIFSGNVSLLYSQSDAIVYCSSSCGLEAYGKGIPAFRYKGNFIDFKMGEYSFTPDCINSVTDLQKFEFMRGRSVQVFSNINPEIWEKAARL